MIFMLLKLLDTSINLVKIIVPTYPHPIIPILNDGRSPIKSNDCFDIAGREREAGLDSELAEFSLISAFCIRNACLYKSKSL